MTLGTRVRLLREESRLTQDVLARRAELQPAVFSRLERDEVDPRLSTVERVARALGVSMSELFVDVDWSWRSTW